MIYFFIGKLKLYDRMKKSFGDLIISLRTMLINLNVFPIRTFGSNLDRATAKRSGQLATRLYIVLLIIGFTILGLYTIARPESLTKNFMQPSFAVYENLVLDHNDTLQCACSSISSIYARFISIKPKFHPVST